MKPALLLLFSLSSLPALAGLYGHNTWPRRELTACFVEGGVESQYYRGEDLLTSPWPEARRAQVRAWVEQEFTRERTGIRFVGWQDCARSPRADLPVHYSDAQDMFALIGNAFAEIGYVPVNTVPAFPLAHSRVWFNAAPFNRGTVIHEFGHVAGLFHEHLRDEAAQDPACATEITGMGPAITRTHGRYDRRSVMNYCFLHGSEGATAGLSKGDLATLRFLYP